MKKIMTFLFVCISLSTFSQGYDSDLYALKKINTINSFYNSEYKKMMVKSYITVGNKPLLEYSTIYKKNFFIDRLVSFKMKYTENYVLKDYDKSFGQYLLSDDGLVLKYERTDFGGKRGLILGTEYHSFKYKYDFVVTDQIRYKEYYNIGAVGADTMSTTDYLYYVVEKNGDTLNQRDKEAEGKSFFIIKNDLIIKEVSTIVGYVSESLYQYNESGQLISKEINLMSDSSEYKITTRLKLEYNSAGLLSKVEFSDESYKVLERKEFTYK